MLLVEVNLCGIAFFNFILFISLFLRSFIAVEDDNNSRRMLTPDIMEYIDLDGLPDVSPEFLRYISSPDVMEFIDLDDYPDEPTDLIHEMLAFLNDDSNVVDELGYEFEDMFGEY